MAARLDRRAVLKLGAGSAAGLVLGFHLPARLGAQEIAENGAQGNGFGPFLNAWLRISPDETVTLVIDRSEMGQGVYTSLPMLLAEELGCDWRRIRVVAAPADPIYRNLFLVHELLTKGEDIGDAADWFVRRLSRVVGQQVTGGSSSVRGAFKPLRTAGAAAREMLVTTAARRFGVAREECTVEAGEVRHAPSERKLSFGALAAEAALLEPPRRPPLKPASAWRLIGKSVPRLDLPSKIDGSAIFGIDVRLPDMLFAAIAMPPVFGGKLKRYDSTAVLKRRGVSAVVPLPDGVAVVADNTWRAQAALAELAPEWDDGGNAAVSSETIEATLRDALAGSGRTAEAAGDPAKELSGAARRVSADYELPYLAHATMEPMNATARIGADGIDIWIPTQVQEAVQKAAAEAADISTAKVRVHTTYLGGGFGRRLEADLAAQAVRLAKAVGKPVQAIWSREEDTTHDFYRPATAARLEAGLDAEGRLVAWRQTNACPSIMARVFPAATWLEVDQTAVEGATRMPYAIANRRIAHVQRDFHVPVGFWRSVGHSQNAFFKESFVDELAAAAGTDPLAFRRRLLAQAPRDLAVLELAAEKAGWGDALPPGRGRGIALHTSFGSIVAQVAEVTVSADGVSVERIVAAVDCGIVVNPDTLRAQIEGGIVFGLTAALYGRISIEKGRVAERHFDDYPMVRLGETPEIEVHVIASDQAPGGAGEPAVPPVAPAIANAIYAATGKRLRRLPVAGQPLTT
ncbi:xanthine dehydrogenase family protein molybdopterin-binding subunit [Desertibaculum subflavum]|uniref:xanthine dehydrogenase family protein molybdopterin-binding subunit n=1 Tax=Desertibaculum subflavum TaxID=2268458 RepID=UPI000E667A2F